MEGQEQNLEEKVRDLRNAVRLTALPPTNVRVLNSLDPEPSERRFLEGAQDIAVFSRPSRAGPLLLDRSGAGQPTFRESSRVRYGISWEGREISARLPASGRSPPE